MSIIIFVCLFSAPSERIVPWLDISRPRGAWGIQKHTTPGPHIMRFLGLGKSHWISGSSLLNFSERNETGSLTIICLLAYSYLWEYMLQWEFCLINYFKSLCYLGKNVKNELSVLSSFFFFCKKSTLQREVFTISLFCFNFLKRLLRLFSCEIQNSFGNGILLPKLFWPTVRKNCSSDWDH